MNIFSTSASISIILVCSFAHASHKSTLEKAGDMFQIFNPLTAAYQANLKGELKDYSIIFAESQISTNIVQQIGRAKKLEISKRPNKANKKAKYHGFPSGHTMAAWSAAAYMRQYQPEKTEYIVPLYSTAILTGYSRVRANKHSISQVLAGAALAEAITAINYKFFKPNVSMSTDIGNNEYSISFSTKF